MRETANREVLGIKKRKIPEDRNAQSGGSPPQSLSLPDRIERMERALTAEDLAELLSVSKITVFKHAAAGRIPSFRIGTCVRFDPKTVAQWLRMN